MGKNRTTVRAASAPDPRQTDPSPSAAAKAPQEGQKAPQNAAADGDAAKAPRRRRQELVSVTVPQAFNLHDDDGVRHRYEPGVQDMPRDHADHWYAKAHGVEKNED